MSLACGINPLIAAHISKSVELHDVGKAKIPSYILNKPGKLSQKEFELMKYHTLLGAEMLSGLSGDFGVIARNICAFHHEQYGGKGYCGVYADNLPLYVQIASICDVAVALLHKRVYKSAWPPIAVFKYIKSESGKQFNPMLVEIFLSLMCEQDVKDILKPEPVLN